MADANTTGPIMMYCVKCRTKREAKNVVGVKMKNGKDAAKGECTVCNAGMYRIGLKVGAAAAA
jgi:hypothetical protein